MSSKQVTSPPWNSRRGAKAKKWFGHRAGRSPCAHSIGKFFLCYIFLFLAKLPTPACPAVLVRCSRQFYKKLPKTCFLLPRQNSTIYDVFSPSEPQNRAKALLFLQQSKKPARQNTAICDTFKFKNTSIYSALIKHMHETSQIPTGSKIIYSMATSPNEQKH